MTETAERLDDSIGRHIAHMDAHAPTYRGLLYDSWSASLTHSPMPNGSELIGARVSPRVSVAPRQYQTRSRNRGRRLRPAVVWETPHNYATFLLARNRTFPALATIDDAVGDRERRVAER
jgi:hypothetical protein